MLKMRGDTSSEVKKPNVSSYALPALSSSLSASLSASTNLTTSKTNRTYKFGESTANCRSSTSSSLQSSSSSQTTESKCSECSSENQPDLDLLECQSLLSSQTDSVESRSYSVNRVELGPNLSNHNSPHDLPGNSSHSLSHNQSSSSRTYTKSRSKGRSKCASESLSESASERDASESVTQNTSKSLPDSGSSSKYASKSESNSDTLSENTLQSSTRRLLDASNSLYTTAEDCSCPSSLTLTCDANDAIRCSNSSCLISACCSANINYINKLKEQHDRLVELDETECFEHSDLEDSSSSGSSEEEDGNLEEEDENNLEEDESSSSSSSSQKNSKTQSSEVNEVKSEDQSTYNQSHTYTLSEDEGGLQEHADHPYDSLNRLKLTSLNALITRTNQASHFNRHANPTNSFDRTNLIQLTNRINKNYKQSDANTADSQSNGYARLTQASRGSDLKETNSRQRTDSGDQPDDRTTVSETNSSPLNDEDTSSLSQLTKSGDSLRTASTVPTQQPSGTLVKPLESSTFNQLTDKQLIEMQQDDRAENDRADSSRVRNSDRLVTMNLDESDELFSDEEKLINANQPQMHQNTMSDISMLSFPEVDENVDLLDTYKQLGASSKCGEKCSSKNHHDLIDETNTYNDTHLLKEFDDLNTSTAQVRFDEDNQLYKYADPTIHSGDHSSELDSDLDAEFDREEDELVLLQQAAEQVDEEEEELPTDICDYDLQENRRTDASHCRIIDLKKLAQDDNIIFSKTNLENFVSSKYSL